MTPGDLDASSAGGAGGWRSAPLYAAVFVGALVIALGPIADGDIYWHLAAGREMLHRRALLRTDPFTLSAAGRPWVDVHWLFQLAVTLVHRAGGFVGLTIAKAVIVAAGAVIVTRAAARAGGAAARGTCAAALLGLLFLARHLLPLRPVIATLLFIALHLHALEAQRAGARRTLWLLPFLQIVWVNCQGLAPLGPALVACYLVGALLSRAPNARRALRPLTVALGLSLLASLATPYGLAAVKLPGHLLARLLPSSGNVFGAEVAENIPPFALERTAPEQIGHFRWVLLGLGLAFAAVRPRLAPAHALVLTAFAGLALLANRNVLLFYWVAAPLAAIALAPTAAARLAARRWPPWLDARARGRVGLAALALALGAETVTAGVALAREPAIGSPTPFHFPVESARRLAASGAEGAIFAPDQHGGYLLFTVPALRPYIDTRLVLHTAREYADYLTLFEEPARFDALAAAEGFRYVLLTTAYPDRYLGLVAHLAASRAWRLAYTDGFEVLFTRDGPALALGERETVDAISAALDARFRGHPELRAAARLNLARMLIVVGQPDEADRVLSVLDSRAAVQLRARGRFSAGELGAAEGLTRILLLTDPRDARSLTLMAQIALDRGLGPDGRRWLGQALEVNPYDPEARAILARLEAGAPAPPDR